MKFLSYEIDTAKLLTQAEVLELLKENNETYQALAEIGNRYHDAFGNELIWHYPISDGDHSGSYFVLVQEGILSIPYNTVEPTIYEIFESQYATMLDEAGIQFCIDNWIPFSDDLLSAMKAMQQILANRQF